ncbi:MAG: TRAP transporter large permease [Steroidobacteraceae bacterium]
MMEWLAIVLLLCVILALLAGYPVAFTLAGLSLLFAGAASLVGAFDLSYLEALPSRLFGIMNNSNLIAVPLFILMGVVLEKSRIAAELLETLGQLFGGRSGGLAYSVVVVGALLAASTGIVGASVVTMGLLALPVMLRNGYDPRLASGTICASGTLGQIIPPSIILVLLGDVMSSAHQQAQLRLGNYAPEAVSVGDLFLGALLPGLLLVVLYLAYIAWRAWRAPASMPPMASGGVAVSWWKVLRALLAPLSLILAVLGSILAGMATPSEAAAVGAVGAMLLAGLRRELSLVRLGEATRATLQSSAMVFMILIGASVFSLVFRGLGGDALVHGWLEALPGGYWGALAIVMLVMFLLGFIIDFIEITYIVVPIAAPALLALGMDPIWLGVLIALNLQTSFLTPPFGFALFFLRGVAPAELRTRDLYRGAWPFVAIQLLMVAMVAAWPSLATWLPSAIMID